MISLFGWLSLASGATCLGLGVTVYLLNRKALINKLLCLTTFFAFAFAFSEVMVWSSNSYQEAYFWTKTDVAWPFLIALLLQFALVFTQSKFLKSRLTYLLLYVPAALIAITGFFTEWLSGTPTLTNWGYQEGSPATLANILSSAWSIVVPALACTLCFRYYLQAEDTNKKKQSLLVAVGITIPSVAYAITSTVFSWLQIDAPNIGHLSLMFLGIFVSFAIVKHNLFKFDAAMAAENIISTIPDPLILTEQSGKILRVNGQLSSFLDYNEKELIGKSLKELFDKGGNQPIDVLTDLADGKMVGRRELICWTKTGEKRNILLSGSAVRSKTGRVAGFVCVLHDITSRKKMEQALRTSEERFRSVLSNSMDIIYRLNVQTGCYEYWSPSSKRILGFEPEELMKMTYSQILSRVHPEDLPFLREELAHVDETGKGFFEYRFMRKDGSYFWWLNHIVSTKDANGKPLYRDGYGRDVTESKKLSDALTESEKKFRAICTSARDAIILIDDQAKIIYWNPAAEKTFGYTSTEAMGKSIHELVVPLSISEDAKIRIDEGVNAFAETGVGNFIHGTIEVKGRHKNGSEFPAESSISPVKLGGKWGAVAVVKDITSRKQAEQTVREAEQRYHALFDQSPLGVLLVDPQTARFVEFNDVACKQLGYSREEFAGLTIPKIEVQETVDDVKSHAAQMVKEGGEEFETKHRTKEGEIRSVLVSTKTVELAGKTLLHCIFHDITEIRRVQDALMESETRYRQLVELAQEGVWVLDKEYNTTFVNRRMAQMIGDVESEMAGKSLFEFVDKKYVDRAKQVFGKYPQGIRGEFECEFLRKDGSRIYTSIAASQVTDDQGHYLGTLALVADITLRKQMADKLAQYSKNLEELVEQRTRQLAEAHAQLVKAERLAAIGELAGMVGHDLRNPLTGIKNAAYFLEERGTEISIEQSKAMLKTIDRCVEHSNKIINDLLDYSREIRLERQEISPIKLLSEVLAMMQTPEKVKILNHLSDEPLLKIDPDKMKRVFANLIKNAIDAMPNGGTITISSEEVNGSIQISVTDTGIGIADEVLPKLFLPLFTTKARGMGFGLAICKRVVEAHEGTITVETAKGKGSTFTVTLPIRPKLEVGVEKFWLNMPEPLSLPTTKAKEPH